MDLRKRRSQEKLQSALAHHLQFKTIDAITIGELTRTAGVSRQTFYSNFSSKQSILLSRIEALLERTELHIDSIVAQGDFKRREIVRFGLQYFLEECSKEKNLMRVAFTGQAGIQCLSTLKAFLMRIVSDGFVYEFNVDFTNNQLDLASDFGAGAVIGTVQGWLVDETGEKDIQSVVEMYSELLRNGISNFIKKP